MNIREFPVIDGHARIGDLDIALSREELDGLARDGATSVLLGFRPESVDLVGRAEGFPVVVRLVEQLGADAYLYGNIVGTESPTRPTSSPGSTRTSPADRRDRLPAGAAGAGARVLAHDRPAPGRHTPPVS